MTEKHETKENNVKIFMLKTAHGATDYKLYGTDGPTCHVFGQEAESATLPQTADFKRAMMRASPLRTQCEQFLIVGERRLSRRLRITVGRQGQRFVT